MMELKLKQPMSLSEVSKSIDADLVTDMAAIGDQLITHIAKSIDTGGAGSITFLANPLYKKFLPHTKAAAVLLTADDAKDCPVAALVTRNPRLSLAKLIQLCYTAPERKVGIHPTAILAADAKLSQDVTIGPYCVVGARSEIAAGVTLQAGVVIGEDCSIGAGTEIKANVTLYNRVRIGAQCTIHSNTVLGSDGFGYAADAAGNWVKLEHLGGVVIGNQVEIGSSTTIDRGMLDDTVIGNQVIIDNQVQIAHNVTIGDKTAIAGCVGIAGSTSIGKHCLIGGAASIAGHLTIGDFVNITGTSAVNHSLSEPGVYSSGLPARENSVWRRNVARFMLLDSLAKRVKELEKQINETSKSAQDTE